MSTTERRARSTWTRTVVAGQLIAALAVLAILPVRRGEDAGFAVVMGAVLLLTAALVWRFGLLAHLWAALLGLLLTLLFAAYTFADLSRGVDDVGIFVLDVVVTIAGATTLAGALGYLLARRRTPKG